MQICLFSTGEKKLIDTTTITEPVFKPLQNESIFLNQNVEHGLVSWDNGDIDIAPEYIYEHGLPYEETDEVISA